MISKLRREWAAAERAAVEAEAKVALIGQAAAHPKVAELLKEATELRQEADRLLKRLVAAELDDRNPGA